MPELPSLGSGVNDPISTAPAKAGTDRQPGMMLRPLPTASIASASVAKPSPLTRPAAKISGLSNCTPPASTGQLSFGKRPAKAASRLECLSKKRRRRRADSCACSGGFRRKCLAAALLRMPSFTSHPHPAYKSTPSPGLASTSPSANATSPLITTSITFPRTFMPSNGLQPQSVCISAASRVQRAFVSMTV